jgi:hypothetical protein
MRNRLALRVVGVALLVIGLSLSVARASETWWCDNGQLMVQDEYGVWWMGTEYSEGNMSWSCDGNRLRTVMRID